MAWKDDIEENVKCGLVDILILKLLSKEDMYGYQIRQEISARNSGGIDIKEGSLYDPLYRLPIKLTFFQKRYKILKKSSKKAKCLQFVHNFARFWRKKH